MNVDNETLDEYMCFLNNTIEQFENIVKSNVLINSDSNEFESKQNTSDLNQSSNDITLNEQINMGLQLGIVSYIDCNGIDFVVQKVISGIPLFVSLDQIDFKVLAVNENDKIRPAHINELKIAKSYGLLVDSDYNICHDNICCESNHPIHIC